MTTSKGHAPTNELNSALACLFKHYTVLMGKLGDGTFDQHDEQFLYVLLAPIQLMIEMHPKHRLARMVSLHLRTKR